MNINMQLTDSIFLTAIGLIASGYDLYNKNNSSVEELVDIIIKEYNYEEIVNYFKKSRTDTCSVNPYWPRGSAIYAASLFLTSDCEAIDLESYISFEKQSNSSNLWQDESYIEWIKQLPYHLGLIRKNPNTEKVVVAIKNYINSYEEEFNLELNKANEVMEEFKADRKFQVTYLPNVLQADECTDYIKKDDTLYVVATKPRFSSIVHEYLHLTLEPYRYLIIELYKVYNGSSLFNKDKLSALGYLWDDTLESEIRCIEEGFARGLTVVLSTLNDTEKKKELEALAAEGFLLAEKFIEFIGAEVKEKMLEVIIQSCFI